MFRTQIPLKQVVWKLGLTALKGREILGKGLGRYGHKIKAAWYDGRGQRYTIVDSPAIENKGKIYCVSCLTIEEMKSALIDLVHFWEKNCIIWIWKELTKIWFSYRALMFNDCWYFV